MAEASEGHTGGRRAARRAGGMALMRRGAGLRELVRQVERVAPAEVPNLGERGTGTEGGPR